MPSADICGMGCIQMPHGFPILALFQPFPSLRVDRVLIMEFHASHAGVRVNQPNPMDREGCSRSTLAGYLQEVVSVCTCMMHLAQTQLK